MTTTLATAARSPLRDRDFRLLLLATVGMFANYAVLLPLVPAWAARGGAGPGGAGATNGVFMLVTVATQVAVPTLGRRFGYRVIIGAGAAALGLPSLGYALTAALPALIGFSALRGVGFGLLTVSGAALVAELAPAAMRGRATALYGLAIGIPNVVFLPLGGAAGDAAGYPTVFVAAGVAPIVALGAVLAIRHGRGAPPAAPGRPVRVGALAAPWTAMLMAAVASAAIVTFVPLAVPGSALIALAAFGVANLTGRYVGGAAGDRGLPSLLLPAGLLAAGGIGVLALAAHLGGSGMVAAIGAGLAFGFGFGVVQNQTLVTMFHRAGQGSHGAASAVWNIAYDAGSGVGSVGLGLLAGAAGYPWAFATMALVLAAALPASIRAARSPDHQPAR